MTTITIAGKQYQAGDIAFTDDAIALLEAFLSGSESPFGIVGTFKRFRKVLEESLIAGSGPDAAAEAMGNLKLNFNPQSDLMNAMESMGKNMIGKSD